MSETIKQSRSHESISANQPDTFCASVSVHRLSLQRDRQRPDNKYAFDLLFVCLSFMKELLMLKFGIK